MTENYQRYSELKKMFPPNIWSTGCNSPPMFTVTSRNLSQLSTQEGTGYAVPDTASISSINGDSDPNSHIIFNFNYGRLQSKCGCGRCGTN